jgi:maltose-binding protein MalE
MMDYIVTALVLLLAAERILRRVAPLTATTRDDEAVAQIDRAREWVRTHAPLVVAIIEDLAMTGRIPAAEKAKAYWQRIEAEYMKAHNGASMPQQAAAEAKLMADGIAAMLPHRSGQAPTDPRQGPASE